MTGLKTLERRVISWLLSDDTGASSTSICAHMLGEPCEGYAPSDCSDLGRCLRLLDLVPEWAPRLHEMATYGPDWKGLLEQWDQIVHLYHNEGGVPVNERPRSPETYRAMKLAIAEGFRNDPSYECSFGGDGTLMWCRKIACETEEEGLED
ncbi:hypothetical protein [Pseudomonas veronii]|uniref:hypothetical protein n=1 Tax=Pseudomonas veronii TaxID=76761 RepID=UPI0021BF47DF|nr:hypothetical protein [Pseudomonas veronii]MCT9827422.1 hypothetical protein [Pseudomonas veronii]